MTVEEVLALRPGDQVAWNDPDEGLCQRFAAIRSLEVVEDYEDAVVRLTWEDGGELECWASELVEQADPASGEDRLCSDCPPQGYPTDATRCAWCPRRKGQQSPPSR